LKFAMQPIISHPTSTIPPAILPKFQKIGLVGKPAYTQTPAGLKALVGVATWLTQQEQISCWIETNTALSFNHLTELENLSDLSTLSTAYNTCELQQLAQHVDALVVMAQC
jgi:hypothetical protein